MEKRIPTIYSISVIIPIYNEEQTLIQQVAQLINDLKQIDNIFFEILLIENGSTDNTLSLAKSIARQNENIHISALRQASYGTAIMEGLKKVSNDIIVQFDIDLIDVDFLKNALFELSKNDIVVGSKLLKESNDARPISRIFLSRFINILIKSLFHYKGTDTHGIKVYKKDKILPLIKKIQVTHHFFDTEILLLAQREGLRIKELPINCAEMRQTRFPTTIRFFQAIKEFWYLIQKYA